MSFVCLNQKKYICFGFLKGQGCVESKNKTSAKSKSTMSSLDPSIIHVASFKCRAGVPLVNVDEDSERPDSNSESEWQEVDIRLCVRMLLLVSIFVPSYLQWQIVGGLTDSRQARAGSFYEFV